MASFWEELAQGLGSGIFGQAASSFDPYAEDRKMRQGAISKAMADYDAMMAKPGGFIPEGYRKMLHGQAEESRRASRPMAGGSAWLENAVAGDKNAINLSLAKQELDAAQQQRQYLSQLMGIQQPQTYLPRQAGAVEKGVGQVAGRGMDEFSDWIFGPTKKKGPTKDRSFDNGMSVGQDLNTDFGNL